RTRNRRRGPSSVVFGKATTAVTRSSVPTIAPQHSCGYVSWPCARIARSTSAVIVNARLFIVARVPERFVEIFFGAVRKDGDDNSTIETTRDVEHCDDRRAG